MKATTNITLPIGPVIDGVEGPTSIEAGHDVEAAASALDRVGIFDRIEGDLHGP